MLWAVLEAMVIRRFLYQALILMFEPFTQIATKTSENTTDLHLVIKLEQKRTTRITRVGHLYLHIINNMRFERTTKNGSEIKGSIKKREIYSSLIWWISTSSTHTLTIQWLGCYASSKSLLAWIELSLGNRPKKSRTTVLNNLEKTGLSCTL